MSAVPKPAPPKVRIDKWLWATRLYKTRTVAAVACDEGKVLIEGIAVKPSRILKGTEIIEIRNKGITYRYQVKGLLEKRVGAALVSEYLTDLTTEEEKEKEKLRTAFVYFTGKRHTKVGRPTKKDARTREKFLDDLQEGKEETGD